MGISDPIIFRALKSITLENTQQISLLRLAQQGISVSDISTVLHLVMPFVGLDAT